MPRFFRKLLFIKNIILKRKTGPRDITEERWIANFSKPRHAHFDIKSESSYDAKLQRFGQKHCLSLGIKKTGCIAWVEAPDHRYSDHIIESRIRIDARGAYAAAGIMFRVVDGSTYYSFLISTKGYFRLDVLRNGMPQPLVGWTELPGQAAEELTANHLVDFTLGTYGRHIIILIRGQWAAEITDSTILEGHLCFTAASYEEPKDLALLLAPLPEGVVNPYTVEAILESLIVDSRLEEARAFYDKWSVSPDIDPLCRYRLAETFTAMDQHKAALLELRKAWETPGYKKQQRELLLAGRLAEQLGLLTDAERYISECFQTDLDSPEGKEAVTEMAKILCTAERYRELKNYCAEAIKLRPDDPLLRTFQGHAYWNLKEYNAAAAAYDKAFRLDRENGILAKNAANVYEVMNRKAEALDRYLTAGRVFLSADNYEDLGLLVPKLLSLGDDDWEAHALAGKWAFGIEDWKTASEELEKSEELRKLKKIRKKDAASVYLRALLLIREGKRREALPLLENAADLEKNYALFHFRLAENRFLIDDDPSDPKLRAGLDKALVLEPGNGWINNFAAQLCLRTGDLESASGYLEHAEKVLGCLPVIRVNRAVLLSLQGRLDRALKLLEAEKADDPDGMLANCAGNLLVQAGRYEEADEQYRKALSCAPENSEYLSNRASCLIELGLYGEADEILARVHRISPSPAVLELISYVASKKGEYLRAETACRSALEMDPKRAATLFSLGWLLVTLGRHDEAREILGRLDSLELAGEEAARREEFRTRLDAILYTEIPCASCGRSWKVLKNPPVSQAIRLYATPPDDLPAGSCPGCGKAFCIGCAKNHLDPSGRFICPDCGKPLKLINEGLKKIVCDWAESGGLAPHIKGPGQSAAKSEAPPKRKRGRPPKNPGAV
jgi:tetratricopeptide (TPR) repeat protein